MDKTIIIKRFRLEDVRAGDKVLFNTRNHYNMEGRDQPADYREKIAEGYTYNWIDKFHPDTYHKITLDKIDLRWMQEAIKIGK